MNDRRLLKAFVAIQLAAISFAADRPCEQPSGHFHQVTRLRGTVVGVNASDWRHAVRWFRQRASVGDAKLTLYEYRAPLRPGEDLRVVKVARTNKHGVFDFGVLPKGHYTLRIDDSWGGETRFDVEITSLPKPVDIVMIDVSPLYPTAIAR
jgi:hypothetical protein